MRYAYGQIAHELFGDKLGMDGVKIAAHKEIGKLLIASDYTQVVTKTCKDRITYAYKKAPLLEFIRIRQGQKCHMECVLTDGCDIMMDLIEGIPVYIRFNDIPSVGIYVFQHTIGHFGRYIPVFLKCPDAGFYLFIGENAAVIHIIKPICSENSNVICDYTSETPKFK